MGGTFRVASVKTTASELIECFSFHIFCQSLINGTCQVISSAIKLSRSARISKVSNHALNGSRQIKEAYETDARALSTGNGEHRVRQTQRPFSEPSRQCVLGIEGRVVSPADCLWRKAALCTHTHTHTHTHTPVSYTHLRAHETA